MGFDMNMGVRPTAAAAGYDPQYPDDPGYFRIVQHGMPLMRLFMVVAEVLDEEIRPALPPWPPAGLDGERAQVISSGEPFEPPLSDVERATLDVWTEGSQRGLAATSPLAGRVPAFKFRSNMGWIVSADEARAIAGALQRTLAENPERFLDALARAEIEGAALREEEALLWIRRWAKYNEVAARHDGYRVE